MNRDIECIANENNDRLKVISIKHLKELHNIIDNFKEQEELNDYQKWIVNELYQFEAPEPEFKVNSIILIAIHHPFYAEVDFISEGNTKTFLSLVRCDFDKAYDYIKRFAEENRYSIKIAKNLPLKRLAAHSGFAKYGRNNITYIDGLGSNFSYAAYFSDMICEEDTWGEVCIANHCNKCNLCLDNCPTGAIRKDRFLIDNQRCLTYINEAPGEFPLWLPATAHHTLYDCLICQRICPMNYKQKDNIIERITFSKEETTMLLQGISIDTFSKALKAKVHLLGIDECYDVIPRNLKVLLEL